jgi:hypothetical protein
MRVVYPLAETGQEQVSIIVSYPGLAPVSVPVKVDLNKQLVSLKATNLNPQGQWVLDRLNTWLPIPSPVVAVFNDGSESEIGAQFPLEYILDESAQGVIELEPGKGMLSKAVVSEAVPVQLTIRLKDQPQIQTPSPIPIVAKDAIPEISFQAPAQVKLGENIEISAQASDDVGIKQVQFFMDGALVGVRNQAPYELSIQTTDSLIGKDLLPSIPPGRRIQPKI